MPASSAAPAVNAPTLPPSSGWRRWLPWLLLALQLLATTAVSLHGGDTLRYADERDYHGLAERLNAGQGYVTADGQPTAFRAPGWPWLLAAVYRGVDHPLAVKLLNGLCLAVATLLLMRLVAARWPSAQWAVPLLMLLSPLAIYSATTLYPQVFALFLFVLALWLLLRDGAGLGTAILAGAVWGYLTLCVSSFLMLLPFVLFAALWCWRGRVGARLLRALCFVVAMGAVMAPWIARNHQVFGAIVPVSTNGGLNLWIGNSPTARPNSGVNTEVRFWKETEGLDEVRTDAYYRDRAVAWIREDPVRAATLYVQKAVNYFNYRNEVATAGQVTEAQEWIVALTYYPLLALVLWRIACWRRRPPSGAELTFVALYFLNALLSALFFTRLRFRVPFDALLLLPAAVMLESLVSRGRMTPAGGWRRPNFARR